MENNILYIKMACLQEQQKGVIGIIVINKTGDIIHNDSGIDAIENLLFLFDNMLGYKVYLSHDLDQETINRIYNLNPEIIYFSTRAMSDKELSFHETPPPDNNNPDHRIYRMALFTDDSGRLSVEACHLADGMSMCTGFCCWIGNAYRIDAHNEQVLNMQSKAIVNDVAVLRYRIAIMESELGSFYTESAYSFKSHERIEKSDAFISWDGAWREHKFLT